MKSKKFAINPNLLNYFGAIANAVNIARADPASITQYLTVAGQVLEVYEPKGANRFFGVSRTFFAHHALHYEKSYRLYARDDKYSFEFIVPETVTWEDPPAEEAQSGGLWEDEPAEETTYDLWESTPTDETTTDEYWTGHNRTSCIRGKYGRESGNAGLDHSTRAAAGRRSHYKVRNAVTQHDDA